MLLQTIFFYQISKNCNSFIEIIVFFNILHLIKFLQLLIYQLYLGILAYLSYRILLRIRFILLALNFWLCKEHSLFIFKSFKDNKGKKIWSDGCLFYSFFWSYNLFIGCICFYLLIFFLMKFLLFFFALFFQNFNFKFNIN